jgi:hypothetical protein
MDALNNFANQEIFNMAKEADETGERIVGVNTKCDAVSPGDEAPVSNSKIDVRVVLISRSSKSHRMSPTSSDMGGSLFETDPPRRRIAVTLSLTDMLRRKSSSNKILGLNCPRIELEFRL